MSCQVAPDALSKLPPNARYVFHVNECLDWGTWGWLLATSQVDVNKYQYFILMNSSVRGPFLPAYWKVSSKYALVNADSRCLYIACSC